MVFIRNIQNAFKNMQHGFVMILIFKSRQSLKINNNDKLDTLNGDLHVKQYKGNQIKSEYIIDCHEIESIKIRIGE